MQFSNKVKTIPEALSIYINQLVYDSEKKGKDIIVLSLGEAFFNIPMYDFSKLDFVKGYHYSSSKGITELRETISKYYKSQYQAIIDPYNEILITAGSKSVIFFAMQATLNEGDEVLIHEPGWLSYQEQIKLVGAIPIFIPYNVEPSDFNKFFSNNTKMVVINNPNNPAGKVYSSEELQSIYSQCRSKGIYVLVDEAYSDFVVEDKFCTMANIAPNKDGVIIVNSLSKNMGMSGWRVGYVIAEKELINEILKLNQHIITCAPTILQYYMSEYFEKIISITLPQAQHLVKKRNEVSILLDKLGLKHMKGSSTFYFFMNIEDFPKSSLEFSLYLLLRYQIAVIPGSAYGKSCERYIRISIGVESNERIQDALKTIKDVINIKNYDSKYILEKLDEEGFHMYRGNFQI